MGGLLVLFAFFVVVMLVMINSKLNKLIRHHKVGEIEKLSDDEIEKELQR
ncbi:hypothetical protein [Halalkalibacillus sediminis]|nr:hypothetical protein [Halalkalibacillus sediminis]